MLIENILFFALGALVAGLLALIIMPAVWKRAVRLTKRRIEAATPITMAEFRADKDQLRAEFALETRRLEMTVEGLRKRLAEQLGDVNQKRTDLGTLKAERDQHIAIVKELEAREADLRTRLLALERDGTDLAQRLRMRDRELETRMGEIGELRQSVRSGLPRAVEQATPLSGNYDEDIDRLTAALAIESKRATFLEEQATSLIDRLESSDRRSAESTAAISAMRDALAHRDDEKAAQAESLAMAEARLASAEGRLNALLVESGGEAAAAGASLAQTLNTQERLEALRGKVDGLQGRILSEWDMDGRDEAGMRAQLIAIAADVSQLVYAADTAAQDEDDESLFDRVQRFAGDETGSVSAPSGPISDRMTAMREIGGR
jgi:chromosome segregation ATPase